MMGVVSQPFPPYSRLLAEQPFSYTNTRSGSKLNHIICNADYTVGDRTLIRGLNVKLCRVEGLGTVSVLKQ
jgi:hypothetical protein